LERLAIKDVGKFYGHFVYFTAIWYILWSFWYVFAILVSCTEKNLATLSETARRRCAARRRVWLKTLSNWVSCLCQILIGTYFGHIRVLPPHVHFTHWNTIMVLPSGWPDAFEKKSPKLKSNQFFVKINTSLLTWKKLSKYFGYFCNFTKTSPNRREFAQSGHPACLGEHWQVRKSILHT
jgi:hypothetical protein